MAEETSIAAARFLKNIFRFSVSSWINFVLGIVSVTITTRLLSPEVYGSLNLFRSAAGVLVGVFCFGLEGAMLRFFHEPPEGWDSKQLFAKCFLVVVGGFLLISTVIVLWFPKTVAMYLLGTPSTYFLVLLLLKAISIIVLTRFFIQYYRMMEDSFHYTIQNVLSQFFTTTFVIGGALVAPTVNMVLTFDSVGIFVLMIVYFFIQRKQVFPEKIDWDFRGFRPVMRFALFAYPNCFLGPLQQFLLSYIIVSQIDNHALGIFASTGFVVAAFEVVQNGFRVYWAAFMYRHYKDEQDKIIQIHNYVLLFLLLMMSGFILGQYLIYLFIGENFHASRIFFTITLVAPFLVLLEQTTGYGPSLENRREEGLIISIVSMVLHLGCLYALLPLCGVSGAAFASAIATTVGFLLSTWRGQVYYRSIESWRKTVSGVALLLVLAASNYILAANYFWECIMVFLVGTAGFIVFRQEILRGAAFVKKMRSSSSLAP